MTELRLYTLVQGHIVATGVRFVSPTGDPVRRDVRWPVACWLVVHPQGILLWDAGMPDIWATESGGFREGGMRFVVTNSLSSRLADLGLDPARVTHLAFSHLHIDHAGNADLVPHAAVIVHGREWNTALANKPPGGDVPVHIRSLRNRVPHMVSGDHDVFGDGTVIMLEAPGHTSGHMVLLVRLPDTGPVLLAGDLWYRESDRADKLAPSWNDDFSATWRSMARIERVLDETGARLVIGHDQQSVASLPQLPGFLS